jgi:hypothetical protein
MGARFCSMSPASLGRRSFARPVLSRRGRRGSDGVALLTHLGGATYRPPPVRSPHPHCPRASAWTRRVADWSDVRHSFSRSNRRRLESGQIGSLEGGTQ